MAFNSSTLGPVVVVGGGFAGLTTVIALSKYKPRPQIILIEPRSRFVFLPLLYELLSGELQAWEVAPSYKSLLSERGISVIEEFVEKIDANKKQVITSSGLILQYSQVVVCTGSTTEDFGVRGFKENAFTFYSLEAVERLRKLIYAIKTNKKASKALVIVGAGATGIELACKISDLLDGNAAIHLIELGPNKGIYVVDLGSKLPYY